MTIPLDEARVRAAVAQYLTRVGRDGLTQAKEALLEHMGPGDRAHARIDGVDVATISVTAPKGREVIKIVDEAAFTRWVTDNQPDAIQTVVAEWYRAAANLRAVIDATGEVPDGVLVAEAAGVPTVQVRISDDQETNMRRIIATMPVAGYLPGGDPA